MKIKRRLRETTLMPGSGEMPTNIPPAQREWDIKFHNQNGNEMGLNDLAKKGKFKVGDRIQFNGESGTIIKYNLLGAYTIELDSGITMRKVDQDNLEPLQENTIRKDCRFCNGNGWHKDGSMCDHCFGYGLKLEGFMNSNNADESNLTPHNNDSESTGLQNGNEGKGLDELTLDGVIGKKAGEINPEILSPLLADGGIEIDASGIIRKK